MKTILLPTDFSATAQNAADYAVQLAQQIGATRLVLFHAYDVPVAVDPLMPGLPVPELDAFRSAAESRIYALRHQYLEKYGESFLFDVQLHFGSLLGGLSDVCTQLPIDLIVMGITGGGAVEETLVGSNTLGVANELTIPLLIVPPHAQFQHISKVLMACDFEAAETTIPVDLLQKLLTSTQSKLHVINVEDREDDRSLPAKIFGESAAVYSTLASLNPSYHFLEHRDFTEAVNGLAEKESVQIIVNLARKRGFFDKIFRISHTKKLAFHSHLPVLVLRR
ncbi:MAG: universal stress protein [Sphingobacteriia bacterium]|nr:MAG: universal stress protein [Sphingobacteriia bacterium]